jgi:hypothetical protein
VGEPDRGHLTVRIDIRDSRPWVPWWRSLLLLTGGAALAYGCWLLLSGGMRTAPSSSLPWLAGTLLAHDAVLAPAALAAGWTLWWLTSQWGDGVRRAVVIGAFVAACLALVAAPALLSDGTADNPTATPRDYGRGLAVLVLADIALTATLATLMARRRRRRE